MALSEVDADAVVLRSFLYFLISFRASRTVLRISRVQFVLFDFLDSWVSLIAAALCILQLGTSDIVLGHKQHGQLSKQSYFGLC